MMQRSVPWLAVSVLISPLFVSRPHAEEQWERFAAIAYSPHHGDWVAIGGANRSIDAEDSAVNQCNALPTSPGRVKVVDAEVAVYVKNGWCALALGRDRRAYGYGWADSPARAMELALAGCRERTTECYVAVVIHSHRPKVVTSRN